MSEKELSPYRIIPAKLKQPQFHHVRFVSEATALVVAVLRECGLQKAESAFDVTLHSTEIGTTYRLSASNEWVNKAATYLQEWCRSVKPDPLPFAIEIATAGENHVVVVQFVKMAFLDSVLIFSDAVAALQEIGRTRTPSEVTQVVRVGQRTTYANVLDPITSPLLSGPWLFRRWPQTGDDTAEYTAWGERSRRYAQQQLREIKYHSGQDSL